MCIEFPVLTLTFPDVPHLTYLCLAWSLKSISLGETIEEEIR